jgi:hypothetical protein
MATVRKAMKRVGLIGVSSHSFRRTALTQMSNNGTPLRVIQEVSGHRNLEHLQVYIEVRDDQVLGAVTGLSMLSPMPDSGIFIFAARGTELSNHLPYLSMTGSKTLIRKVIARITATGLSPYRSNTSICDCPAGSEIVEG